MGRRGVVQVALGAVAWGAGGTVGVLLGQEAELPAVAVAAYRVVGGGLLILLGLAAVRTLRGSRGAVSQGAGSTESVRPGEAPAPRVTRDVVVRIAVVGVLVACYAGAYFQAVFRAGVAVATLVALGVAPVLVAAVSAIRRRRAPRPRIVVALAAALTGLTLLVLGRPDLGSGPAGDAGQLGAGIAWALGAAVVFALLVLVNGRQVRGLGPVALTGWSFTLGGLGLLIVAGTSGGLSLPTTTAGWALLVFLALVPTAVAYVLYFGGLPRVPATTAAMAALLEPVSAAGLAAVLLGERLGVLGVVGGGVLVLGVVLALPRPGDSPTMDHGPGAARSRSTARGEPRAPKSLE